MRPPGPEGSPDQQDDDINSGLIQLPPSSPRTGVVHVPGWLDTPTQRRLVEAAREWSKPPAGLHRTAIGSGVMSVASVCLGWHWTPSGYSKTATDVDGAPVKPFPDWLGELGRAALRTASTCPGYAGDSPEEYAPDVALVNFYDAGARMGMHTDSDERSTAPVVSLSIGDECLFRIGDQRTQPWDELVLASGDLLVFGGPARLAYHGVPRTRPGTGPAASGMRRGRLNITLRESGLTP